MRQYLKTLNLGDGVRALVRFKIGNHNIVSLLCRTTGILEHLEGLPDARGIAQINFQVSA